MPADDKSVIDEALLKKLIPMVSNKSLSGRVGESWTTDAPYRETQSAITGAKALGASAVEMEASALYAFSKAKSKKVIWFCPPDKLEGAAKR